MNCRPVVLALVISLLAGPGVARPVAADSTPNAVTWTITDPNTITVSARIEIYPVCPGWRHAATGRVLLHNLDND